MAFTVVFSIALSVLSALLTIGATAADATAMLLRHVARVPRAVRHGRPPCIVLRNNLHTQGYNATPTT